MPCTSCPGYQGKFCKTMLHYPNGISMPASANGLPGSLPSLLWPHPARALDTSLQPQEGKSLGSLLTCVGVGGPQCFLWYLAAVEPSQSLKVLSFLTVPFLVLWLEGTDFCWSFFHLCPLAFLSPWLLQFQPGKSEWTETQGTHPHPLPQNPMSLLSLSSSCLSESLSIWFI